MRNVSVFTGRISVFATLIALAVPAIASNEDLKSELNGLKSELSSITGQLDTYRTGELAVRRDIELTANVSFLRQWLAQISTPYAEISAVATSVEGDLIYVPGRYKVFIEHPEQTKAWIRWSRFSVTSSTGQLDIAGSLLAHAESRVILRSGIINSNILCETKPNFDADI